eukprot:s5402_g6.t1
MAFFSQFWFQSDGNFIHQAFHSEKINGRQNALVGRSSTLASMVSMVQEERISGFESGIAVPPGAPCPAGGAALLSMCSNYARYAMTVKIGLAQASSFLDGDTSKRSRQPGAGQRGRGKAELKSFTSGDWSWEGI